VSDEGRRRGGEGTEVENLTIRERGVVALIQKGDGAAANVGDEAHRAERVGNCTLHTELCKGGKGKREDEECEDESGEEEESTAMDGEEKREGERDEIKQQH